MIATSTRPRGFIVDCDIHQPDPLNEEFAEYLPEPYKSEIATFGPRKLFSGHRFEDGGMRWDLRGEINGKVMDEPAFYVENLLDRYDHRFGLLTGNVGTISGIPDPDYAAALASGLNDRTMDVWLPVDDRLGMSILIPLQDINAAVAEIRRLGEHPRVKAVSMYATANRIPFGDRYYWPIYAECEKLGLPIHMHPSTTGVIANHAHTPAGEAATYFESHVTLPTYYMAQTASLILRGVFEQFPNLRIILVEGGISWLPHVLWRMDAEYKGLKHEVPFLKRLPSQYVRDNIRLTTQPIEDSGDLRYLQQIMEMVDAENTVMYASDFPHWDFDEPSYIESKLGTGLMQKLLHDNACEYLNLDCDGHPAFTGTEVRSTANA